MRIEMTEQEIDALKRADKELFEKSETSVRCPRCGNEIIVKEIGTSYTIRCKTEKCIAMTYRGI